MLLYDMALLAESAGLIFPFYPMRPRHGAKLDCKSAQLVIDKMESCLVQPKLNGDRVCVVNYNGRIVAQNRHGREYSFSIHNRNALESIPNGTVLDGEVWKGDFYPFECLVIGNKSLMMSCVTLRVKACTDICSRAGIEFVFGFEENYLYSGPTDKWEGVVLKMKNKPYIPLGTSSQESSTWVKMKWN